MGFRKTILSIASHRLAALALCCLMGAIVLISEMTVEARLPDAPYFDREGWGLAACIMGIAVASTGAFLLLTRRVLFSLTVTIFFLVTVASVSKTKQAFLQTHLLYPDLFYYLRDWAEISFFFDHYFSLVLIGAALLLSGAVVCVVVYVTERGRASRLTGMTVAVLGACCAVLIGNIAITGNLKSTIFYQAAYNQRHLSTVLVSGLSTAEAFGRPMSIATPAGNDDPQDFQGASSINSSQTDAARPTIVVILHESSVDPAIYFDGDQYHVPSEFFESGDGERRRLHVETYGGRTWISEYGFLLGLNASYLGPSYEFLGIIREGKFKNTLPQRLKELGYITVADYPSSPSFMNTGRFYRSIGFDVINTPDDMGLYIVENSRPQDIKYYDYVLKDLSKRTADGVSDPMFYFVWTTGTHYPYRDRIWPDVRPGERTQGDQAAEFARRQRIAADDLKQFELQLKLRFPKRKFVVAGFGDHHPLITYEYLTDQPGLNIRKRDLSEPSDLTYYRITGINFAPAYDALNNYIEIGYLADSIMSAARLPLGSSFGVRSWLRNHCRGLWLSCPDVSAVRSVNAALSAGQTSLFN